MRIDSDVLGRLTRGHLLAAQRLQAINPWGISAVACIELAQGCCDKAQLVRLKKGLAARQTEIVPITPGHLATGIGIDRRTGAIPRVAPVALAPQFVAGIQRTT